MNNSKICEFIRCQRADGTFYGTSGKCRKGREVDPRKEVEKLAKKLSATKGDVLKSAVDPDKGLIGKGKDLGNGISVVKGDIKVLENLGGIPGLPRPVSKVVGEGNPVVVVARKNVKPWKDLDVPKRALTPFRADKPMAHWLSNPYLEKADIDMAVNPTLLTANSLLKPAYDRYNKEFFGGKLPNVDLYVAPSMTGAVAIAKGSSDGKKPMFIAMSLKHLKNSSEEAIHGILLHEMVHVHDYSQGRFTEGHGKIFTTKLNKIHKDWKRDSKTVYPDKIHGKPEMVIKGGLTYERVKKPPARQFPKIQLDKNLRKKAVVDDDYRVMVWK